MRQTLLTYESVSKGGETVQERQQITWMKCGGHVEKNKYNKKIHIFLKKL